MGVVNDLLVNFFCSFSRHFGLSFRLELFLAINFYNNFAAFSALTGSDLDLLGKNFCNVFAFCMFVDVLLKLLTMLTKKCLNRRFGWRAGRV